MERETKFPPPPQQNHVVGGVTADQADGEEASAKMPWHKPTIYDLTELTGLSGSPTNKHHPSTLRREDETRTPTNRQKRYRPHTTPA